MGGLIPSDEEVLWLNFGWWIRSRTHNMDESKFGAILGSLRMNKCIADGPRLAGGRSAVR